MGFKHMDIEDYAFAKSEIPYANERSHDEQIKLMLADIEKSNGFVLTAVSGDLGEEIMSLYDLAVFLSAPKETRMERIEQLTAVEQWADTLSCPVVRIDGTAAIEENALQVMRQYSPQLPSDLAAVVHGYSCEKNRVGCSSAGVYRYHRADKAFYLKIAFVDDDIRREHELLLWLNGKLPVPEVIYWREHEGFAYLLMTEILGRMTCNSPEDTVAQPIENTVKLLANGLLMLQAVSTTGCPFDSALDKKLARALINIQNNTVDTEDWEDNNNFDTPMDLYQWLTANKPPEETFFTHGDYCLPNIFINGAEVAGFIDVGRGGVADRWQDIALCVRSLGYNLRDTAGAEKDKYIGLLFSHLGIKPDWEKINYYILLDELF
jgi:kanamycin kinase/aminoglycoside 3'-phosphotransferase-3